MQVPTVEQPRRSDVRAPRSLRTGRVHADGLGAERPDVDAELRRLVISPTPLTDYVPLQYDTKGDNKIITQYDMHSVGEDGVGLLKFDFQRPVLARGQGYLQYHLGVDLRQS